MYTVEIAFFNFLLPSLGPEICFSVTMAFALQVLYCLDLAYARYADISAGREKDARKFLS